MFHEDLIFDVGFTLALFSEGDPMVGWWKAEAWRADATYAGLMIKVSPLILKAASSVKIIKDIVKTNFLLVFSGENKDFSE